MDFSNREEVKSWFEEIDNKGWWTLIDIIYDNKPAHVEIREVWSKYAGLRVSYHGEDEAFEELVNSIEVVSQKMCEICGQSGSHSYIDGWETTLCDQHFESSDAKNKSR